MCSVSDQGIKCFGDSRAYREARDAIRDAADAFIESSGDAIRDAADAFIESFLGGDTPPNADAIRKLVDDDGYLDRLDIRAIIKEKFEYDAGYDHGQTDNMAGEYQSRWTGGYGFNLAVYATGYQDGWNGEVYGYKG